MAAEMHIQTAGEIDLHDHVDHTKCIAAAHVNVLTSFFGKVCLQTACTHILTFKPLELLSANFTMISNKGQLLM